MIKLIRIPAIAAAAVLSRNEKQPSLHKQSKYIMSRISDICTAQTTRKEGQYCVVPFPSNKKSVFETNAEKNEWIFISDWEEDNVFYFELHLHKVPLTQF